jgi:hypothetical protein
MPSVLSQLLRRPPGSGWLTLSGGRMPEEQIQRALALVDHAGCITAVVPAPGFIPAGDDALQAWIEGSGRCGGTADCESSDAVEGAVNEAALVLLPDLPDPTAYIRALGQTDACVFLLAALDGGAVIVAEGSAAQAMGELVEAASGASECPGLNWIPGAVVHAHFSADQAPPVMFKRKNLFRIGLPVGVTIAMGPEGEREIWGDRKPTITFREWWKA